MKTDIHPKYEAVQVQCSCGNKFEVGSTYSKGAMHLDICSECHPFYTGKQKMIDTGGRVDKFNKKYAQRRSAANTTEESK